MSASVITVAFMTTAHATIHATALHDALPISLTFQVRVCERPQPLLVITLSAAVGVPTAQLSVALAVPSAASISAALRSEERRVGKACTVLTCAVVSNVQVTVHETATAALPHG